MKRYIFLILIAVLFLSSPAMAKPVIVPSDEAFSSTWDGVSLIPPSKNVVYDALTGSYQPLEDTLTDIADGTIAEDLVNTAYPWADNEVKGTHSFSFVIYNAVAADDFLIRQTPDAITITSIHGVLLTGTNVVGAIDECDGNGANCVVVDSDITFDGSLDSDDHSLSNATIDANDWIRWHTTSSSAPGYLTITVFYTID